jgi:hypothetical protein
MLEASGNIWDYEADAIVITTNGTTKKDGSAVMGRGVAEQAKESFPGIDRTLGELLEQYGLQVHLVWQNPNIVAFPVKRDWWEKASLGLIARSALELVELADVMNWTTVIMPRPGCGNGRLRWQDVSKVLSDILDDRFVVVHNG